jgi:hypothetical protein
MIACVPAGPRDEAASLPGRCIAGSGLRARPRSLLEPVDVVLLPIVAGCIRIRHASIVTATQEQCIRSPRARVVGVCGFWRPRIGCWAP